MTRLGFGILLTAFATLVLELMLTRVFDVVLAPNLAYYRHGFHLAGTLAALGDDRQAGFEHLGVRIRHL